MTRESRPTSGRTTLDTSLLGGVDSGTRVRGDEARAYCDGLRRRRAASDRLVPLTSGQRDPWPRPVLDRRSTYGLAREDVLAEARRLRDQGWQAWEIDLRLDLTAFTKALPRTANQRAVTAVFAEHERSA